MNNPIKKIALIMAALTCASAMASAVSAGGIFLMEPEKKKSEPVVEETVKETEKEKKPAASNKKETFSSNAIFTNPAKLYKSMPKVEKRPSHIIKEEKNDIFDIIEGGKFCSVTDAKKELIEYFRQNCGDIIMYKGESRVLCAGAYFYSDDSDVVIYNELTGSLEAVGYGEASVYVYTKGGVPFYRFDVTVVKETIPETLTVTPDSNYILIGETIDFTVTDENGDEVEDVTLSLVSGTSRAVFSRMTGKLTALKNGPIVVRAESKSDPDVYGECLIYIGYRYSVCAGDWYHCDGGIRVDKWFGDICTGGISKPSGWIKCLDGTLIPVLKLEEAPVVQPDGTVKDETVLYKDSINIFEYLKNSYDIKSDYIEILKKYNLIKYGIDCDYDKLTWFDLDYKNYALSLILKDILG